MSHADLEIEQPPVDPYNQIIAKTRQRHFLFGVHWELTYRCNAHCAHCYLDVLPPQATPLDELDPAECVRVLDELAALGALHLTFSGGEILTRRDFFAIAEHARTRRFLIRLMTNGIAITPRIADRIAALHPFAVEMSLYSTRPETHDQITRRARSFELTTRAFRLLRERGVRTVMKTLLMRENIREFDALKQLAAELGAQFRYDSTITPKDSGDHAPLRHRLTDDDRAHLFRTTLDPAMWQPRIIAPDQPTCGIGSNALLIDPYGNVFPCVQLRRAVGNVRAQSLKTIWEDAPLWRELRGLTWDSLPVCRACALSKYCARCHGLAQLEHGDLRAPALINCAEALARWQALVEKSGSQE